MSRWFLRFTREMSLPTYYLIFKGYQGMLKEFGDSFEFLMYVSKDGVTRGYRQVHDDARFSQNCKEALSEGGLAEKVLDQVGKRFERFCRKQQRAMRYLDAHTVQEAFDAYESLWKLYIVPVYWGASLDGLEKSELSERIHRVRERTGGTAHRKGAEGLLEELIASAAKILSEKTGMPAPVFHFATPDELIGCLQGKTPPELMLEQRQRAWVLLQKKGNFKLHAGGEAEKIARKELSEEKPPTDGPQRGTVAFGSGIVEGVARVAFKVSESVALQEGEILITPMTSPEYVPAMKRSMAIVTDEGGITCHAAILARELEKPCLVGTKDATRVFKTGDKVRIDLDAATVEKKVYSNPR